MGEVLIVQDEHLTTILRTGKYDPLIYLNSLDGRPNSKESKAAFFDIPNWASAVIAHIPDDETGLNNVVAPNILIEKTEVFFVHDAFTSSLSVGITFEISVIINAINYVINTAIGEDPEGSVYIWCPLSWLHNTNFAKFMTQLNVLAKKSNRDIVLLIEKVRDSIY